MVHGAAEPLGRGWDGVAWIRMIHEDEAEGQLKAIYEQSGRKSRMGNIPKIFSLRPEFLATFREHSSNCTFGGTSLGRRREELISVMVCYWNACEYCTTVHTEFLRRDGGVE